MASSSIPRTSGIYKTTCTTNGKIYIGSAVNLRERQIEHFSALRTGKHFNEYLQRAFEKYGAGHFTFCVIEECVRDVLLEREQHYLNSIQPFGDKGFNVVLNVTAGMDGRQHTLETKRKIGEGNRGKIRSPEERSNLRAKLKGRPAGMAEKKLTPEQILKLSRKYIVTTPDGVEIEVFGLFQFCRENNLSQSHMCEVANGKRPHHKRWKCRYG